MNRKGWATVVTLLGCILTAGLVQAGQEVSLKQQLYFAAPDGGHVQLPAGTYRVEAADGRLRLLRSGGTVKSSAIVIAAKPRQHQLKLPAPAASLDVNKQNSDLRHLVLLLPGGTGLQAVGSLSAPESAESGRPGYFDGKLLEEGDLATAQTETAVEASAAESKANRKEGLLFAANQEIQATLLVDGAKIRLSGSISLGIAATHAELQEGLLRLRMLNVVLQGIDQSLLIGKKGRGGPKGVLGFRLSPTAPQEAVLKYDNKSRTISGTVAGEIDFPWLTQAAIAKRIAKAEDRSFRNHAFAAEGQKTELQIKIVLQEELPLSVAKIPKIQGTIEVNLTAQDYPLFKVRQYIANIPQSPFTMSAAMIGMYELVKHLCVQPVYISRTPVDLGPTGEGLWFGLPTARTEWDKADVIFDVKRSRIVIDQDVRVLSSAEEAWELGSRIEDDSCVEVYFIEAFNPSDLFGGGLTYGLGMASTFIVSSDENDNDIDFTHLAHEFGHAMGLAHPGMGTPNALFPNAKDGTSGTLMCPSGFENDNPQVNSRDNSTNISNPLFTVLFRTAQAGLDCTDDTDCGACP